MAKARGDNETADLFGGAHYYPVRAPVALSGAEDMKRGVATAMGEAIRACGKSRAQICVEMTEMLGDDEVITIAQLNAYTAESRTSHTISIVRWVAFVRATGCNWLWDWLLKDEGLIVLEGEEAHLANAALMKKQAQQLLKAAEAAERAAPVNAAFRKPRRGA